MLTHLLNSNLRFRSSDYYTFHTNGLSPHLTSGKTLNDASRGRILFAAKRSTEITSTEVSGKQVCKLQTKEVFYSFLVVSPHSENCIPSIYHFQADNAFCDQRGFPPECTRHQNLRSPLVVLFPGLFPEKAETIGLEIPSQSGKPASEKEGSPFQRRGVYFSAGF